MLRVENALSQKKISGLLILCYENERPPQGMLGYLDWRFSGQFTELLRNQVLTGTQGELLYFPLRWNEDTYHFLIVGAGQLPDSGVRPPLPAHLLEGALRRADQLKLAGLGISLQDFRLSADALPPALEARNLCILN